MRRDRQGCGSCGAWVVDANQIGQIKQGTCRRDTPKAYPVQIKDTLGNLSMGYQAVFPPMLSNDWCYRWVEQTTVNVSRETAEELEQLRQLDPGKVMWKS